MRLVAVMVVVATGALLVAVAEVAHSFSSASRSAGEWAATGGLVLCGLGLMGMFVELYPPDILRDTVRPRPKFRRDDKPRD
jgi:hypothetical protein